MKKAQLCGCVLVIFRYKIFKEWKGIIYSAYPLWRQEEFVVTVTKLFILDIRKIFLESRVVINVFLHIKQYLKVLVSSIGEHSVVI